MTYGLTTLAGHPAVFLEGATEQKVVGESFRMSNLDAAAHRILAEKGQSLSHFNRANWFAWLIPEPSNPHDRNAVQVFLGPFHVGYLPRAVAPLWQPYIMDLERYFKCRVACQAQLRGQPGFWGVVLKMP